MSDHYEIVNLQRSLDQLRADNARLKSEVEALQIGIQLLETGKYGRNELHDQLQSHKAALEKARVALWHVEKYLGFCSHPIVLTVKDALATINELLQKVSK